MERVRNLTQAYSQTPWRRQTMFIGLFLLVVIFAALVAGIYLDVTARTATIGREIQVMEEEIEALKLSNADLESRWAFLTSSEVMEQRSHSLGFQRVEMAEITFLLVLIRNNLIKTMLFIRKFSFLHFLDIRTNCFFSFISQVSISFHKFWFEFIK